MVGRDPRLLWTFEPIIGENNFAKYTLFPLNLLTQQIYSFLHPVSVDSICWGVYNEEAPLLLQNHRYAESWVRSKQSPTNPILVTPFLSKFHSNNAIYKRD